MFERFSEHYKKDDSTPGYIPANLGDFTKHNEFFELFKVFNGCSFGKGVYRILDCQHIEKSIGLVEAIFPQFENRFLPFGYDWLGRYFAKSLDQGSEKVFLFSCLMNEVLEIPVSLGDFHSVVLIENFEPTLEMKKFHDFLCDKKIPNLGVTECADMVVPLYMGGEYVVSNMKIFDLNLMWEISEQLSTQLKNIEDGQNIGSVRIMTN